MKRIVAACVVALALAGCSSLKALPAGPLGRPEPLALARPGPALDRSDNGMVCDWEQKTGSHIARQVCRSAEARELERLKAENLLHLGLQQHIIVIH